MASRMNIEFDPINPSYQGRTKSRSNLACPCGKGIMFDVTPALVEAMGVKHYECGACHQKRAVPFPNHPSRRG
jgi:hypothetical protein